MAWPALATFRVLLYTVGMSMNIEEVEEAMLALDRRELAALIHRGIQALDHADVTSSQDEIDAAWRDEIVGRIADVQSGKVDSVPAEDALARIRAKLTARHQ